MCLCVWPLSAKIRICVSRTRPQTLQPLVILATPPPQLRKTRYWLFAALAVTVSHGRTPPPSWQGDCVVYVSSCTDHVYFYVKQVPAIQQKRTVAFLNQFVVHTVQFLNRFSTVCEEVGPSILVHWVAQCHPALRKVTWVKQGLRCMQSCTVTSCRPVIVLTCLLKSSLILLLSVPTAHLCWMNFLEALWNGSVRFIVIKQNKSSSRISQKHFFLILKFLMFLLP